jgi:hypothetical protein
MAEKKKDEVKRSDPPRNYAGQVANQETTLRDAKVPDEKPDESTVAQVEEVKES